MLDIPEEVAVSYAGRVGTTLLVGPQSSNVFAPGEKGHFTVRQRILRFPVELARHGSQRHIVDHVKHHPRVFVGQDHITTDLEPDIAGRQGY